MRIIDIEVTEFVSGGEVGATGMGDDRSYTGKEPYDKCVERNGGTDTLEKAIKSVIACI